MVKISRRSDGGKSTKMSFKNVRYGSQKTVSNHLKLFSIQKGNSFVGNVIRAEGLNIVLLKAKNTGKRKLVTRKENMKAIIPKGSVQNITEKIDSPIQFGGGI